MRQLRAHVQGQLLPVLLAESRRWPHRLEECATERVGRVGLGLTLDAQHNMATAVSTRPLNQRLHQRQAPSEFSAGEDAVYRFGDCRLLDLLFDAVVNRRQV